MDLIVVQKNWFDTFKVKITVWTDILKTTVSSISAELLQPNWIGCYIIINWSVLCKKLYGGVQGWGHSEGSKRKWIFVSPIFSVPLISWQAI